MKLINPLITIGVVALLIGSGSVIAQNNPVVHSTNGTKRFTSMNLHELQATIDSLLTQGNSRTTKVGTFDWSNSGGWNNESSAFSLTNSISLEPGWWEIRFGIYVSAEPMPEWGQSPIPGISGDVANAHYRVTFRLADPSGSMYFGTPYYIVGNLPEGAEQTFVSGSILYNQSGTEPRDFQMWFAESASGTDGTTQSFDGAQQSADNYFYAVPVLGATSPL